LNSSSLNIDEALYLQEEAAGATFEPVEEDAPAEEFNPPPSDEDLDQFDWESAMKPEEPVADESEEESLDDLLGDFLSQMNK
jgi:hypothetical protein